MLNEMLGGSLETHLLAVSSPTSYLTSWALNVGKAFCMCPAGSSTKHRAHSSPGGDDLRPKSALLSSPISRYYTH